MPITEFSAYIFPHSELIEEDPLLLLNEPGNYIEEDIMLCGLKGESPEFYSFFFRLEELCRIR